MSSNKKEPIKIGNLLALVWVIGLMINGNIEWYYGVPILCYLMEFKINL